MSWRCKYSAEPIEKSYLELEQRGHNRWLRRSFVSKNKRKKEACKNKSAKYELSSSLFFTQHYYFAKDPILFGKRRKFWRASQGEGECLFFFGFCGTVEEVVLPFQPFIPQALVANSLGWLHHKWASQMITLTHAEDRELLQPKACSCNISSQLN